MLSREYIDLTFLSHSSTSTSTSDSDPDPFPVVNHKVRTMAFRDSPRKRRKTNHSNDDEDEDEDPDELLRRFQKKPATAQSRGSQLKPDLNLLGRRSSRPLRTSHSSSSDLHLGEHHAKDENAAGGEAKENAAVGEAKETGSSLVPEIPLENEDIEARKALRRAEQRQERDLLTVKSNWGDAAYPRYQECSGSTKELLSYMSKRYPEKTARYYIFNEILQRMNETPPAKHGRPSPRRVPEIKSSDAEEAKRKMIIKGHRLSDTQDMQPPALRADLLQKLNLRIGASGLLEPAPASRQLESADAIQSSSSNMTSDFPKEPALTPDSHETPVVKEPSSKRASSGSISASSSGQKTYSKHNIIDLTSEESAPALPKSKSAHPSAPIVTDDSTSTERSTPIMSTMNSRDFRKTPTAASKPATVAIQTFQSAHSSTPLLNSTLKSQKKRLTSAVDATISPRQTATVQPSDMQRPVERTPTELQTPGVKHSTSTSRHSSVKSPSRAKHESSPAHSLEDHSDSFGREWSREDDCLMVYLKTVFNAGPTKLAAALPGRTPGACSTRYSTRLRHGRISLQEAIDCLNSSRFRHHIDPEAHNPMLNLLAAGQAPPAAGSKSPATPAEMKSASNIDNRAQDLRRKNLPTTEDETSDQSLSTSLRRPRRKRPKVDYDVKKYFSGQAAFDEPKYQSSSREESVPHQSQRQGARHETTRILPNRKPVGSQKLYKKPYLARHERDFVQKGFDQGTWVAEELKDWRGVSVHIGLSPQELSELENVALDVLRRSRGDLPHAQTRQRIEALMEDSTEAEVFEIAATASQRKALPDRTKESVEAALRDAQDADLINIKKTLGDGRSASSVTKIVRRREFGHHQSNLGVPASMKTMILDTIGPSVTFTGTSNDVNTVAWAPDGVCFAAGSACHVDSDSMQYNRPNNLLFGSMHKRSLLELPEHHTLRERPESGPNSSHSMHVTQDRRLFQTVASVCFSPDGRSMYSAGYDGMVRFWDVKESGPRQRLKMWRNAKIDLLTVSKNGLLATGAQRTDANAITVFDPNQSDHCERWSIKAFNSRRAAQRPENMIYPSTIRFDPHAGELLLAGFASTSREELTCGESCLWDIRTGTQLQLFPETRNVFDVAWNPFKVSHLPNFAVGCVAGSNVNRGVRSVVKMYDIRSREKCGMSMELDCPALDMNDIMFCPYDENLVVAGCTNGTTYVWDCRQAHPEICLYSLGHDQPLMELADPASRERLDTGIRFCSWGHDKNRLYTGSSDGVVKSWDLYRAPQDALVRDVVQLNSGVMCGSFSPDYTSLLLGEVNGSINVLEVGKEDQSIRDMDSFDLKPAPSDVKRPQAGAAAITNDESGVATSEKLVETGQMVLAPMGGFPVRQALQGPKYAGPFDSAMDADDLRDQAAVFQQKLASQSDEQCHVDGCNDVKTFTEEERGDSGRWRDRIPASLSLRPKQTDQDMENLPKQRSLLGVMPKLKCSKEGCDRPVRLRPDDDTNGRERNLFCERHDFGILRPGHEYRVIAPQLTVNNRSDGALILCDDNSAYRADVLGYKRLYLADNAMVESSSEGPLRKTTTSNLSKDNTRHEQDLSRTWKRRLYGSIAVAQEHGNEGCGIDEWHASLWGLEEAPAAPPFLSASSRLARGDSPKHLREIETAPSSPVPPDNDAQQGGAGTDVQSTVPPNLQNHEERQGHDGDGAVQPMVLKSPIQERRTTPLPAAQNDSAALLISRRTGKSKSKSRASADADTVSHVGDQEQGQGIDAVDPDTASNSSRQSVINAVHAQSCAADTLHTDAERHILGHEASQAAATVVETVEGPKNVQTSCPDTAASSSELSPTSTGSSDSGKSRTPCIPM